MVVDRLSFKGSFQIIKTRLPECDASSEASLTRWYWVVAWEISQKRIRRRRNRINPRVIKRKISHAGKCHPDHRKRPPLTKVSEETVVMIHRTVLPLNEIPFSTRS